MNNPAITLYVGLICFNLPFLQLMMTTRQWTYENEACTFQYRFHSHFEMNSLTLTPRTKQNIKMVEVWEIIASDFHYRFTANVNIVYSFPSAAFQLALCILTLNWISDLVNTKTFQLTTDELFGIAVFPLFHYYTLIRVAAFYNC